MSDYDGNIIFKEWLPDLPELENPGLTEAKNVRPTSSSYESFPILATSAGAVALAGAPVGGRVFSGKNTSDATYIHVGSALLQTTGLGDFSTMSGSATIGSDLYSKFAQFDEIGIAVGNASKSVRFTLPNSSFTALAASGTAPVACAVGVINRFVVLGQAADVAGTARSAALQWSAIDDPTNWPTPGSATAIATQAGEQLLQESDGKIYDIFGADQYGIVLQASRVTRLTYVGGSIVFQFDAINTREGSFFPRGAVQAEQFVYFISKKGFCRTDGVSIEHIGDGKVDRYFWDNVTELITSLYLVCATYDNIRKLVYWLWPSGAANTVPNNILIYHIGTGRWSRATQSAHTLLTPPADLADISATVSSLRGFDTSFKHASFRGPPGTAVITTGETEPNPGGFSRMQGIKPLIDVTANAVTVAMGTRNNRTDAVSYTSEVTANSRSGFCDFRSEARYHRARLTIAGTFNAAQGLEYEAVPSGFT